MELKPASTHEEQMELLKNRGCTVGNEDACIEFLRKVNYYRLSAYFLPFRDADHSYKEGTSFEQIVNVYEFDRKLREFIFTIVEEIEICTRSRVAYYHGHKYGAHGYWLAENFNSSHRHDRFVSQIESELERNKNTLWVKHHQSKYDGKYPIWAIIELFSLGMLSHFYADLPSDDRKCIASEFNTKDIYLKSWLRTMTVLRNICAHYGRLYYTMFTNIPKIPPHLGLQPTGKLFDQLLALKLLMPDSKKWNTIYLRRLSALIKKYSEFIDLAHIGFEGDWRNILKHAAP